METSEIDLSEFQEANRNDDDVVNDGNDGPSQGDAQPSNADANPVSGNTGKLLYPKLFIVCLFKLFTKLERLHRKWSGICWPTGEKTCYK